MADSDEEQHDRSRERDKFRRERSDYGSSDKSHSSRSESYRDRRQGSWREDRRRGRDEYESEGRRRYSSGSGYIRGGGRDWSPPSKRQRRSDWDSLRDFSAPGMMTPYGMRPPWMPPHGAHPPVPPMMPGLPRDSPGGSIPQTLTRHMMLTFKQFLAQQDDSIDEMKAIASYNDYKSEFKRKQVDEFFENHKDEDWFMNLYHPTNLANTKEETTAHLSSRTKSFSFLVSSERLDKVSLSYQCVEDIVKVMDTAVIMMEGNEKDLLSLEAESSDEDEEEEEKEKEEDSQSKDGSSNNDGQPSFMEPSEEDMKLAEQAKEYGMLRIKQEKRDSESSAAEANNMDDPKAENSDSLPDENSNDGEQAKTQETNGTCKPRPLHLTHSVYIRHIPPKISANDIIKVCKPFPGFLRVAFGDVTADKGYERRGWATFSHGTDIKSVCAQLSASKVNDCQLSFSVNRDLTRRVKHASPATWTRKAVHFDLHKAMELIRFLDKKKELWEHAPDEDPKSNPVLEVEESLLLEEDEAELVTMGAGDDEEGVISESSSTEPMDDSDPKLKALERLLWYLRLVHSLDYYNWTVFPNEDSMPHRCGIFTVRSKPPLSVTPEDVSKYIDDAKSKIEPLMATKKLLSEAEMEKLNQRDSESEVERFVELNTQKISESKYLCPLSGKKFKGPEFVRKHIFNKHMNKVEAVRREVEFFNNYLQDCERPMPLEASIKSSVLPPNPKTPSADESPMISPMGGLQGPGGPWGSDLPVFGSNGGGRGFGRNMPHHRSRGGRRGRRHINYHDLDAPDPTDDY